MMPRGWFVTGTDTGIGKTFFSSRLLRTLRAVGIPSVGYKPFCSGDRADAESLLAESAPGFSLDEINPVWFAAPAAPSVAAAMEGRVLEIGLAVEGFQAVAGKASCCVVEGAGGWLVPISGEKTMADLAVAIDLPVIVVARNQLGVINHVLLTLESVRRRGLEVAAVMLNAFGDLDSIARMNRVEIQRLGSVPTFEMDSALDQMPMELREMLGISR